MKNIIIGLLLAPLLLLADTPPPTSVKAKVFSGDGVTAVTTTGTSLNVNVTNSGGGSTVDQGTGGLSPWLVQVNNFPASFGRTWTLNSGTDSVTITGSISATNSANGNTGSAVPAQATQVAGSDGTNLRALKVSSAGVLSVDGSATTQPISGTVIANLGTIAGVATEATLSALNTKVPSGLTVTSTRLLVDGSGVTQPVSGSLTVTQTTGSNLHTVVDSGAITATISGTPNVAVTSSVLPTGAATSALQTTGNSSLSSIDSKTLGAGQKTMANSYPVVIASDQSAIPITGSITASNASIGLTGTAVPSSATFVGGTDGTNLRALKVSSTGVLSVDGSAVTQPISAGALPLPAGASTSALQTSGNSSLSSIDTKTPALGQALAAASVPIVLTAAQLSTLTPLSTVAVTQSTSPWVVSGTVTSNIGTTNGLALDATVANVQGSVGAGTAGTKSGLAGGVFNTAAPTLTNGQQAALQLDSSGNLKTTATSTISGTVAVTQSTSPWVVGQSSGANLHANIDNFPATQSVTQGTSPWVISGTVTANAGTNLNTSALALDTSVNGLLRAQGSTTSGQTGPLIQGSVTTAAPTYTTAQTSPLSLTITGALRTDSSATTQPISGNITNISGTISLPTGASTSANQTNGTQKTQVVDGAGAVQGPVQTIGGTNYMPVVLAASATPGAAIVARSIQIAGSDGTNAQTLSVDSTGKLNLNNISGTISLPTGAGTAANQATIIANQTNGTQKTQVTVGPADTAPATVNITAQDVASVSTAQANGQNAITGTPTANSAASFSLASEQGVELQVTGTWTGTIQTEVSMDGGTTWFTRGIKQTGAAYITTSFTQNVDGGMNASGMTNVRVRATAAWTGTATVKIASSVNVGSVTVSNPLTIRDATTQSISDTIKAASTAALATDTSLVVALSPNSPAPASTGHTSVQLVRNDYSSTNVTTGAYVQLIASTSDTTNQLYIFDSSGQTLFLAIGAAASEVNKAYIVPGGNGELNLTIPSGSRVSVKAVSGNATSGELSITLLK